MYAGILIENLYPFIKTKFSVSCKIHQDNDSKHRSKLCRRVLSTLGILWERSPSSSPDLNPVVMMWSDMKSFIRSILCASKNEIIKEAREYLKTLSEENAKILLLS
ncbi:unnamed protein product [Brachionus calyciflorus]|uniref:Tc1-like transposase DDE domain-containing protein n=1 Tax=Brachionus calyciflorus TaxID=104777 RepID=A0A814ILX3_9BILA|nr:unnamed protein product [Brachionus calyciflorus]